MGHYEAERRKGEVDMAAYGSVDYRRNAAYILSAYCQGPSTRADTKAKIDALANDPDPITRAMARAARNW
jgi:hypothetical protein